MFFIVKHGDDQQDLFNSDCSLKLLIESIGKRCRFPNEAVIGLADDRCNIINLTEQYSDLSSCTTLFAERGSYILIAIYNAESGHPKYTALLQNVDPELEAKLESLSNPQTEHKGTHLKSKLRSKMRSLPNTKVIKNSASRASRSK